MKKYILAALFFACPALAQENEIPMMHAQKSMVCVPTKYAFPILFAQGYRLVGSAKIHVNMSDPTSPIIGETSVLLSPTKRDLLVIETRNGISCGASSGLDFNFENEDEEQGDPV